MERPFDAGNARQEIARFYQDWLARGHFFTALALVLAAGAMGLAQQYGLMTVGPAIAPTPIFAGFLALDADAADRKSAPSA